MTRIDDLPPEVIGEISRCVVLDGDGCDLLQVSRTFHRQSLPHVYRHIVVTSRVSLSCLVRTLREHPEYAVYAVSLEMYSARVNWNEAVTLARILSRSGDKVHTLKVRFPADDISQAIDFFQYFSPLHFEWITQRYWMLHPGELLMRFLCNWTRLRSLSLGNFDYDHAFASAIERLGWIETLILSGTSNKTLEAESIRTMIGSRESRLGSILVADCPLRRRAIIEVDLGVAISQIEHELEAPHSAGCVKHCRRCRNIDRAKGFGAQQDEMDEQEAVESLDHQPSSNEIKERIMQIVHWV